MPDILSHFAATPWLLPAILAIVWFAAIVQVGLGMGFGLTAAPLLAVLDPQLVPASTLFLGLATATWGAVSERDRIAWDEVLRASGGRLAGVAAASALLAAVVDEGSFSLVFGLMVGLAVLLSVAGWRLPFTRAGLVGMAAVSGLMGTITSVGAPPLAIVYQDRPAREARPTLAAFFAVGCALSLAGLYATGWAGLSDFVLALAMAPGMIAGILTARRLAGRFDRRYRSLMLGISGAAAVVLVARGLW